MKNRIIVLTLIFSLFAGCLTACSNTSTSSVKEPDIMKVRSICEFATLKCYYHNVAKSIKKAEKGITHIGEKDREFWIEYDGTVSLGIDMSQVQMSIADTDITITIPEAKVLNVQVDETSYNADSFIMEKDGINSTKITAEDATNAVHEAKENMEKTAQANSALLMNAQDRAKELIENYVIRIGEATGTQYNITWEYIDNNIDADSTDADADTAAAAEETEAK